MTAATREVTAARRRADALREQRHAAGLAVARHSTSREDCREMLLMLGLMEETR